MSTVFFYSAIMSCVLAQQYELWTVYSSQQSQLLQTINNTFYPNIEILIEKDLPTIISKCNTNCSVLYSASTYMYPNSLNNISITDYQQIIEKDIRIYIEYPNCIFINDTFCAKYTINDTIKAKYERAVVVSPIELY
eukprot:347662_1